jgi:cellulose synthase/poly-beta-1,6-N-acetylglucosamine synthase-like glycosyltransferase
LPFDTIGFKFSTFIQIANDAHERFIKVMRAGEYWNAGNFDNSPAPNPEAIADPFDLRPDGIEQLPDEGRFFLSLGIGKPVIAAAHEKARLNGTTIERELIADGLLDPHIFYEALAEWLGVAYFASINPGNVFLTDMIDTQLASGPLLRLSRPAMPAVVVMAPEARHALALKARLAVAPEMREGLAIAAPQVIRDAIWQANSRPRELAATGRLYAQAPDFSARIVLSGRQGYVLGALSVAFPAIAAAWPEVVLLLLHIGLSGFYLLAIGLRAAALQAGQRSATGHALPAVAAPPGPLPVYTVLVAAYREEEMVPQMIAALDALDWPRSLLDIKIVCEADDKATIDAVRRHARGSHYEVIEVPPEGPRTKPKALDYALAGARGDYVVIYDAEDRPHPGQLREAHARFCEGPASLGCLQAPLTISNAAESRIAALFALEYAGQFRSLLPLLARLRLPMPLGGTSNHFRRAVLLEAGAWDPYNVTEDADLGIRMHRMGYHCGVLRLPTLEDAPTTWPVWQAQRSRWFKGWLQTILVHFRAPARLHAQIGTGGLIALFLTTGGMLFSALAHPMLAIFILRSLWLFASGAWLAVGLAEQVLFAVDVANIIGSYCLFALLGRKPMEAAERKAIGNPWPGVPYYWMMLSVAAWKAVREIASHPFLWRKTPHAPSVDRITSENAGELGEKKEIQTEDHRCPGGPQHADGDRVHVVAHDGAL